VSAPAYFEYLGFYSMAAIVRHAARFELIRFLKATDRRFLSSELTSGPLVSRTRARKSTISSKRSAYSATRARKMFSSTDI